MITEDTAIGSIAISSLGKFTLPLLRRKVAAVIAPMMSETIAVTVAMVMLNRIAVPAVPRMDPAWDCIPKSCSYHFRENSKSPLLEPGAWNERTTMPTNGPSTNTIENTV
jgi:hypothetical protein